MGPSLETACGPAEGAERLERLRVHHLPRRRRLPGHVYLGGDTVASARDELVLDRAAAADPRVDLPAHRLHFDDGAGRQYGAPLAITSSWCASDASHQHHRRCDAPGIKPRIRRRPWSI